MTCRVRWLLAFALIACQRTDHTKPVADDDDPDVADRCDPAHPRVCLANDVVACEPSGKLGRRLRTCKDGCVDGRCRGQCSAAAELVYAVDEAGDFLSFDPRKLPGDPFTVIGRLGCSDFGTPFSMAVDRNGIAWVLYSNGDVFEVSITDATCKRPATYHSALGDFGMGYVMDAPNATTETMYVAPRSFGTLATLVPHTANLHSVGRLDAGGGANPELTGTRDARLYGFFPSQIGPSFVQEIDKASGHVIGPTWPLGDQVLDVNAYAFAQWGGVFYVFVAGSDGAAVHAVDKTGAYWIARDHVPYRITGAGVSTCAPERDGVNLGHP